MVLVEKIDVKNKFLKALDQTNWYHATTMQQLDSLKNGINVIYNKGNTLDFGMGFYLTPDFEKAKNYIIRNRVYDHLDSTFLNKNLDDKPIVVEYEINDLLNIFYKNKDYKCNLFPKYDERFAKFIFDNRLKPEIKIHTLDFIYGVQSDSNPEEILEQYNNKSISKENAIQELKKSTSDKQLYIGNQSFCNKLKIKDIIKLD